MKSCRKWGCLSLLLLTGLCAATGVYADEAQDCRLTRLATIPMRTDNPARILVPVKLNGHEKTFAIDTGAPISMMRSSVVTELGLSRQMLLANIHFAEGGGRVPDQTVVEDFEIGGMKGKNFRFGIMAREFESGVDGLFGAEIVRNFDLDLDFGNNTINLFSPRHCSGKAIYWTQGPYAALPIHVGANEEILIPVKLDGVDLDAQVDTGAPPAIVMKLDAARFRFGWHDDPPELRAIDGRNTIFSFPFKTLSLGGATVRNPSVEMEAGKFRLREADVLLGLAALRAFHAYISYQDRMIYFTARDAH